MKKLLVIALVLVLPICLRAQNWEQLNDIPFERHHGMGFSFNGKGYVLTGGLPVMSREFWEYTPETDSWSQLADYPGPARGYAMGDDWGGKYYFGFGLSLGGLLNDLWVFDPADNSFTQLPSCPCQGRHHPAFIAHDNKIYVVAGDTEFVDLDDTWVYDINTQVWEEKASIPGIRHHPFHFEINDEIYVGGGHNPYWHKYNPENDMWTLINSDLEDRVAGTQFSYGDKGYVLSGVRDDHSFYSTGEFYEYDPSDDSWTTLSPHPDGSKWAPANFIIDDYLYLVSGLGESDSSSSTTYRYKIADRVSSSKEVVGASHAIELFPNPTNSKINIQWEHGSLIGESYELLDLNGRLILSGKLTHEVLDLKGIEKGTYVLVLLVGDARVTEKVIKY